MDLKRNTTGNYDVLIELGILQNVVEIDSMNYGWDQRAGNLRSRQKYVGDVDTPGLVYSFKDFYHTKFSIKRDDMDEQEEGNVYPWGPVFGVEEITERDEEGNEYLSFDLWMILSQEAEEQEETEFTPLEPIEEEGEEFNVNTLESEVIGPKKAILEGEVTNLGEHSEVEACFKYSKYHKETWWILADPHMAYGGDYSGEDLEMAIDDVLQLGISDHAVALGDIVENRADALPSFIYEMDRLDHGYTYVLGNHDVDGWWWDDEDEAPLIEEPEWGSKEIAGVRFIWLSDEGDGNWEHDGGYGRKMYISDEQNEWFKSLMDQDPNKPTVIMCHQGPCIDGDWADDIPDFWDPEERGWLKEDIDDYNLIAWIHGHRHSWIIDENFQGYGFDRISIDSIDKDTDTHEGMFMEVERIADKTILHFTFRDHANEAWTEAWWREDFTIEVDNGLPGWFETPTQLVEEPSIFREQVAGLGKGEDYLFTAVAEEEGAELDRGKQLTFETMLLDLMIGKVHYDPELEGWDVLENYDQVTTRALNWGLIYEKIGNEVKLYAEEGYDHEKAPKSCIIEYEFEEEEKWNEEVMGIWGKEAKIHTALGFARYEYGKSGAYDDYEVKWNEDGIHKGYIEMNRDQELIDNLQGGAHAFIYSHPHKEVERTDLYGERTELFNGYVTDLSDRDGSLYVSLEGVTKDLDREEDVVLVEDIDQTAAEEERITPLDCFDVLHYVYDHASRLRNFEHVAKGSRWHEDNDRVFSVNGNLLNAAVRFSFFLDVIMRPKFVEEGAFVDVNIDEPKTGETMTVKTQDIAADGLKAEDGYLKAEGDEGIHLVSDKVTVDDGDGVILRGDTPNRQIDLYHQEYGGVYFENGSVIIQADDFDGAGLSPSNEVLNVRDGYGISAGTDVNLDVGRGLSAGTQLYVNRETGGGIMLDANNKLYGEAQGIAGNGLSISSGRVSLNAGYGISTGSSSTSVDLESGGGLQINSGQVEVNRGAGISVGADYGRLMVDPAGIAGLGLKASSGELALDVDGGLEVSSDQVNVDTDGSITTNSGQLEVVPSQLVDDSTLIAFDGEVQLDAKPDFFEEMKDVEFTLDPGTEHVITCADTMVMVSINAVGQTSTNEGDYRWYFQETASENSDSMEVVVESTGTNNETINLRARLYWIKWDAWME